MSKTNYNVLKEYYHIWKYILKQYKLDKKKEIYAISYDYNKDDNSITYSNNDYYSEHYEKSESIKLSEEDFKTLVALLETNDFIVTHHYIFVENKRVRRKNK